MNWYLAGTKVWGSMASGIMFRHNGNILLQLRSKKVNDGGYWGIPGGALKGTEEEYDSEELPEPELDGIIIEKLWKSVLREVREELGFVPKISKSQKNNTKVIPYRVDNFVYVTFVVDLDDNQANKIKSSLKNNWESESHEWFSKDDIPENIHHGVRYVLENIYETDVTTASVENLVKKADKWTQGQIYIDDDENIYDIDLLKKICFNNHVGEVKVKDLVEQLYDKNAWEEGGKKVSPMMVITNPTFNHTYIEHMSRIRMSNLDNPIMIRASSKKVIDGYHRLSKAFISNKKYIKVIYVQEEQMKKSLIKK